MRIKSSESPADYMLRLQRLKSLPLKLHLQVRNCKSTLFNCTVISSVWKNLNEIIYIMI